MLYFLSLTILQLAQRRQVATSRYVPRTAQPVQEAAPAEATSQSNADVLSEAMFRAEAERDLDEEEELFNVEELIQNPTNYTWEDKWRPRKPRYFNRVHTGYEWNKYNQTHYEYVFCILSPQLELTVGLVRITPRPRSSKATRYVFPSPLSGPGY